MNKPNSREEYEKTLLYAEEHRYWAMLTVMQEDGYSSDVDWVKMRKDEDMSIVVDEQEKAPESPYTDNPDLKFKDISMEQYREYAYPNGQAVTILNPVAVAVSRSSSAPTVGSPDSHRIVDASGQAHYLPAGWLHLSWKTKGGKKAFAF